MPPFWMASLLHWRPDRLNSECFVQEHVLTNGFPGPRVLPRAERPLRDIPGLGESDRIVEGNVEKHGPVVYSLEALDEVQLVAMGMAHPVDPIGIVYIDRIDDEGVAVPRADRVTHP